MDERDSENLERIRELLERQYEPESDYGDSSGDPIAFFTWLLVLSVIAIGGKYILVPHMQVSLLADTLDVLGGLAIIPAILAAIVLLYEWTHLD